MIAFQKASARYPGADERAIDRVSFEAKGGLITAVAGPNGSGKSTLVRALLRRVPLESGSILVDGFGLDSVSRQQFALRVSVAPQREELAFPMRVAEYVALGRFPRLGLWRTPASPDDDAVEAAMIRAGVAEFAHRRTDELSGGEWQRARIARALAQEASALVLDEPTTFLDLAHEMSFFELLHSLAVDGLAILIVSHQLNLVARFADHVVLLHNGRVAAAGNPGQVMQASLLEQVYEWPLVITRDPAIGAPSLVPLRRRHSDR
ncbi:MAG TPA: ABC transporter ATP-binding protein [Gemmatimonadaceae bacterium]|nr:ABC transporter ATP-binding protein [Gemmatimonadaceae bacterium]